MSIELLEKEKQIVANITNRDDLKIYNVNNELGVKIHKTMTDEEVRSEINKALEDRFLPVGGEDEDGVVTFLSKYTGLHVRNIIFVAGTFKTSDPDEIEFLRTYAGHGGDYWEAKGK